MSNSEIIKLKEDLAQVLNESNLPVVVKQYVLSDVHGIISSLVPGALEYERQEKLKGVDEDGKEIHKT